MPTRSPRRDERNEIIHNELVHIKEAIDEVKLQLAGVISELGALKYSEISDLKGDIKVLKDRASRAGAVAGIITGALVSGLVSFLFKLLQP